MKTTPFLVTLAIMLAVAGCPDSGDNGGSDGGGNDSGTDGGNDGGTGDGGTGDGGTGDAGTGAGETTDPVDDCGSSGNELCDELIDFISATATCNGNVIVITVETVGGYSAGRADTNLRTGCTVLGDVSPDSLQFSCISRDNDPWGDEFPPELNDGTELEVGPGEGCTVDGDFLQMAIDASKVPFGPATVGCSSAISTGPGTTVNDFLTTFDFDPGCTFD